MTQLTNLENKNQYQLIQDSFNKYVVSPANQFGLGGFIFDIEGETTITAVNEITDHFVEDNSAVQDHIASRPLSVTLNTFVGEVTSQDLDGLAEVTQTAVRKLTTLSAYLPDLSTAASFVKDSIENPRNLTVEEAIDDVNNVYALIKNLNPGATRQQQAYLYFKALRDQKILVSLQTPFEYIPNMAIETLVATQEEGTNTISNFSITLKQIRTVSTKFVTFDKADYSGRAGDQRQPQTDKGKAQGSEGTLVIRAGEFVVDFAKGIFG